MRSLLLFFVLFLAPLLGGCVRTLQPILKDEQVMAVDQSLFGAWLSKEGTESVEISSADKPGTYRAVYREKDGKTAKLLVRLGKVGDLTLAELSSDDPGADMSDVGKFHLLPVYSFLVVTATKPQIVFEMMPQDWLKKFLAQHPNELQTVRRDDDIIVTASTEDFQTFLLAHCKDEGAIGAPNAFVRPADKTTRPATPAK